MADPNRFARRMEQLARNVERNAPETVRRAAVAINQAVVVATPVDTGAARSNWQVEFNRPASGTVSTTSASVTIARNNAEIERFRQGEIHLTNNLPYIVFLNEGSSSQAPANFVEIAIQAGRRFVSNARLIRERQ